MKKNYKIVTSVCLAAATMIIAGCTDPVEPNDPKGKQATAAAAVKGEGNSQEIYVNSANIVLTTEGCASYAYSIVEGEQTEAPMPEIIYAEAEEGSGIVEITGNSTDVTVTGLKGNTFYTIFFALKTTEGYELSKYVTASTTLTTKSYTQALTVLSADKFAFKFHVEIDADKYYRVAFVGRDMYHYMTDSYHWTDVDYLQSGWIYQGPQDIEILDGCFMSELDEEEGNAVSVKPGSAFVLMIGECDENGKVLCTYNTGSSSNAIAKAANPNLGDDEKNYIEESDQEVVTYNGIYARQFFWTEAPSEGVGSFTVTQDKLTELSAAFTIVPDNSILRWGAFMAEETYWNEYVSWVGEDGILAFCLANSEPFNGKQTLVLFDSSIPNNQMQSGKKYKLVVIGQEDRSGAVQISKIIDFEPALSTKPAPEIVITPKDDPDGNPYLVWFNVKCTTKDCASAKYLCNYVPDWKAVLKKTPIEQMMSSYGQNIGRDYITRINSDEGCDFSFSSWENSESIMYLVAYNDEEKGEYFHESSWSLEEPDKEPVESSLFEELLGDWTCTFTTASKEFKYRVTIADAPEQGPATLAEMDKKEYNNVYYYFYNIAERKGLSEEECVKYATDQITKLFTEYKEMAAKYAAKYRGQNRLVVRRCGLLEEQSTYLSPWNLFCNTAYSAYNTEELFIDYGSKIFLEVQKDADGNDRLICDTDPTYIPAMIGWWTYDYYWWGVTVVDSFTRNYHRGAFDMELSEDKLTMTMKPAVVDGETYWPSTVQNYNGFLMTPFIAAKDIVFTKGWTEPATAPALRNDATDSKVGFEMGNGHRFMRTRLIDVPENNIPVSELGLFDFSKKYVVE